MIFERPWHIELVEFDDACTWKGGWYKVEQDKEFLSQEGVAKCHTVGWLMYEDDNEIKLVQSQSAPQDADEHAVDHVFIIPKATITSRMRLRLPAIPDGIDVSGPED